MKKPAIPGIQGISDTALQRILMPMKENIELLTGVRGEIIKPLPTGTTDLAVIVSKINEIIERINAH